MRQQLPGAGIYFEDLDGRVTALEDRISTLGTKDTIEEISGTFRAVRPQTILTLIQKLNQVIRYLNSIDRPEQASIDKASDAGH